MPDPQPPWKEYPLCVLLVDDQAIIHEAVRRALAEQADIQLHYCGEPGKALAKAGEGAPTVILLDLVMPGIDGMTLLKFLRGNKKTRDVPVIVMSSKEDPKTKAEAFAAGASDYVIKIPEKTELVARLRNHSKGYIYLLQRNEAFDAMQGKSAT